MAAANVSPNVDGDATVAFSRSDLGAGTKTVLTNSSGATGAFPHGLTGTPDYAAITYVFPAGGFGGTDVPGANALSICDDTNIGFRIFTPSGGLYSNRTITLRWIAVVQ